MEVTRIGRRWLMLVVLFTLLALVGGELGKLYLSRDVNKEKIEDYVSADSKITGEVGRVTSIEVLSLSSFDGGQSGPPYKIYKVKVKGEFRDEMVKVKVTTDEHQSEKISVYKFDR